MQNDKKSPLNQSLWGKIYQVIITWIVYFLFRPKVEWVDKSVKKQLKGKPAVFVQALCSRKKELVRKEGRRHYDRLVQVLPHRP